MQILYLCNIELFDTEKQIELMKPIRQDEGRKLVGKFQGEPTYQGWVPSRLLLSVLFNAAWWKHSTL